MTLRFENVEVRTRAEQVLYGETLDRINELGDARNARLVEAGEGIPAVLWGVLIIGGIFVVGFTHQADADPEVGGLKRSNTYVLLVLQLAVGMA
jgi:hypothetical protein